MLGGVGLGIVVVVVVMWWWCGRCGGGGGILPRLVRLDLGIGGGLIGDGEEVVGTVSGCEMGNFCVLIYSEKLFTWILNEVLTKLCLYMVNAAALDGH